MDGDQATTTAARTSWLKSKRRSCSFRTPEELTLPRPHPIQSLTTGDNDRRRAVSRLKALNAREITPVKLNPSRSRYVGYRTSASLSLKAFGRWLWLFSSELSKDGAFTFGRTRSAYRSRHLVYKNKNQRQKGVITLLVH